MSVFRLPGYAVVEPHTMLASQVSLVLPKHVRGSLEQLEANRLGLAKRSVADVVDELVEYLHDMEQVENDGVPDDCDPILDPTPRQTRRFAHGNA